MLRDIIDIRQNNETVKITRQIRKKKGKKSRDGWTCTQWALFCLEKANAHICP